LTHISKLLILILRVIWYYSYRGRDNNYLCYIVECYCHSCSIVSYIYIYRVQLLF